MKFRIGEDPDSVWFCATSYEVKGTELIFKRQLSQQATTIAAADYEMVRSSSKAFAQRKTPVVLAQISLCLYNIKYHQHQDADNYEGDCARFTQTSGT